MDLTFITGVMEVTLLYTDQLCLEYIDLSSLQTHSLCDLGNGLFSLCDNAK